MPNDLQAVEFDKDLMYSALWNIVKNAREAMPNGGFLDIYLDNHTLPDNNVLNIDGGDYLQIAISDHGDGMDNTTLKRIFDPFFSVKDKCSGMGLSTAFSIVRKHGGTIVAESNIGVGTTLTVLLPVPPGEDTGNDNPVGGIE
jgi:two-component system, cell cycle sensor histidine kinase and response regulator CckA